MQYIEVGAIFLAVGCYILLLLSRWHRHLVRLAGEYDVNERRRRAARHYPLVAVALSLPLTGAIVGSIQLTQVASPFILFAFLAACLPGGLFWFRNSRKLLELGYGRGGRAD